MKKWMQLPLALAMVAALACNRNDQTRTTDDQEPVGTTGAGRNEGANIDRDYIEEMIAENQAEVELGKLAQERASNPEVRELANMMATDHQQAGEQLKQLASKHNITPGADAHEEHHDLQKRLTQLSGTEFDREYVGALVEQHEKAVDETEDQAQNAENPEVKQWATSTLPKLQQHLERVRQIQSNLQNTNERGNEMNPQNDQNRRNDPSKPRDRQ